jgi:hypothetical protein
MHKQSQKKSNHLKTCASPVADIVGVSVAIQIASFFKTQQEHDIRKE